MYPSSTTTVIGDGSRQYPQQPQEGIGNVEIHYPVLKHNWNTLKPDTVEAKARRKASLQPINSNIAHPNIRPRLSVSNANDKFYGLYRHHIDTNLHENAHISYFNNDIPVLIPLSNKLTNHTNAETTSSPLSSSPLQQSLNSNEVSPQIVAPQKLFPDERRKKFLERNRLAAYRCRQKKKLWVQDLEKKLDEALLDNSKLLHSISSLKHELSDLKFRQQSCSCKSSSPINDTPIPHVSSYTLDTHPLVSSSSLDSPDSQKPQKLTPNPQISSEFSFPAASSLKNIIPNHSISALPSSDIPHVSFIYDDIPRTEKLGCFFYA